MAPAWSWKVFLGISLGILAAASTSPPAAPSNITLPSKYTNHGDSRLLCKPTTATTVLSFLFSNYLAHAVTTQAWPGERKSSKTLSILSALLFPGSGVARGLNNICRGILVWLHGKQGDLNKAAAAGALCMVVRTEQWRPADNSPDSDDGLQREFHTPACLHTFFPIWTFVDGIPTRPAQLQELRNIHGASQPLPGGYAYALVPPNAVLRSRGAQPVTIKASVDTTKILVAIFQTAYASYTLYKARGDQIRQFGFAAFGLTVAAYAVMSLVNLTGSLLLPSYSSLFVVHSEVMDELEQRYGSQWFDGTVGTLVPVTPDLNHPMQLISADNPAGRDDGNAPNMRPTTPAEPYVISGRNAAIVRACPPFQCTPLPFPWWLTMLRDPQLRVERAMSRIFHQSSYYPANEFFCFIFDLGAPLTIIGAISHFDAGNSTRAQRIWTMFWLVAGAVYGQFFGLGGKLIPEFPLLDRHVVVVAYLYRLLYAAPALGGIVVVIQMIVAYGDCILL